MVMMSPTPTPKLIVVGPHLRYTAIAGSIRGLPVRLKFYYSVDQSEDLSFAASAALEKYRLPSDVRKSPGFPSVR